MLGEKTTCSLGDETNEDDGRSQAASWSCTATAISTGSPHALR
jgi:hypothetical protein